MKPFLILQLRPNIDGDDEYQAFLTYGDLRAEDTVRIEMTKQSFADINLDDYSAVIAGGGGSNVSDKEEDKDEDRKRFDREFGQLVDKVIEKDFPFFGACYGITFMSKHLGAKVAKYTSYTEDVSAIDISLTEEGKEDPLLKGLPEKFKAFVGHKDSCMNLPEQAVLLASSEQCPHHMFRIKNNIYATQFHPELDVRGMFVRVNVHKNGGYFPPEDADKVKASVSQEVVYVPMQILKRFTDKYKRE